jgi:hypothetical protein
MWVKTRPFWIVPAVVVASWLAVRSLAALPAYELEDPRTPMASALPEIPDPALAQLIGQFGAQARARR